VATPVQVAAADLIASGAGPRARILDRIRANDAELRRQASAHPSVEALHAEAGWSAVLRVPAHRSEEETVLDLLERDGVVVHPGFFFDFPREAYLVVSLLPDPAQFREGVCRVLERVDG
jgi:aspartate/methionine/tyrosine aminotransferase